MTAIKLLSKNKYLKVPLLFTGGGGGSDWRQHLQPCEYLETDGDCYILTDFKINTEKDFAIKVSAVDNAASSNLFGCDSGYTTKNFSGHYVSNGSGRFIAALSGTHEVNFEAGNRNFIFKINHTANKMQICNFNESVIGSNTIINFTTDSDFALFALNSSGIILSMARSGVKIYYCEHTDVFNLIAVYVIDNYVDNKGNLCSSGVAGIVDVNTGIFYTNDGSGQFSHGNDIEI